IESALITVAGVLLAAQYVTTGLYLRRIGQPAPKNGTIGQPRVALLRPICGKDTFDSETLAIASISCGCSGFGFEVFLNRC
ncbi:MAG: hypothetical protein ABI230_00575, partial [Aestuariivirga sp.]